LPWLVDVNSFRPAIETALSQTLHRKVSLGRLHLQTFGNIGFGADEIQIETLRGTSNGVAAKSVQKELAAKSVLVEVEPWPLLSRKLVIRHLEFDGLQIWLRRDREGSWSIRDLLRGSGDPTLGYMGPGLRLKDSTVNLVDEARTPAQSLSIAQVSLNLQPKNPFDLDVDLHGNLGGQSLVSVQGNLLLPKVITESWGGNLHFKANQLPAEPIVGFLNQDSLRGLKGLFDFDLQAQIAKIPTIKGTIHSGKVNWNWPEVWGASGWNPTDLTLEPDLALEENRILLKKTKIKIANLQTDVQGSLPRYFNRPSQINIAIKTNRFDPFEVRPNLPISKLPTVTRSWLTSSAGKGQLSLDLQVAGSNAQPAVTGDVRFDGFNVSNPALAQPLQNFEGTVNLGKEQLSFKNLKGMIGKSPFALSGIIDHYRSGTPTPQLAFKSDALDLATTWSVITSDLVGYRFLRSTLTSLEGTAKVDLRIAGRQPQGQIILQGAKAVFAGLSQPLEDLRGKIQLANGTTRINGLTGQIAGSPIQMAGSFDRAGNANVQGSGTINFPQILALVNPPPSNLKIDGALPLQFAATGTTRKLNFSTQLNLSRLKQLKLNDRDLLPAQNFNLRGIYTPGRIVLADSQLRLKNLTLAGKGTLSSSQIALKIRTAQPISMATLRNLVPEVVRTGVTSGSVGLNLAVQGTSKKPVFQVALNLQNIAIPALLGGISKLTGSVSLSSNQASSSGLRFQTADGSGQISGSVQNFKDPVFSFRARFSKLDLDRLIQQAFANQGGSGAQLTNLKGQGNLQIDQGTISRLQFQQLQTDISLDLGVFTLDRLQFLAADGQLGGSLRTDLKTQSVQGQITIRNARAEILSSQLVGFPGGQIFGSTNLDLNFQGKGKSPSQFLDSLNGKGSLEINNGQLASLNFMGPIVGVAGEISQGKRLGLNTLLGAINRLNTGQFQQLGGNFVIQEGTVSTNNFDYKGSSLSLQTAGTLRLSTKEADLRIQGMFTGKLLGSGIVQGIISNFLNIPQAQAPQHFSFEVHGPVNKVSSVRAVRLSE
jgi:AsmA-like C-terminal region/Protein of unknown function